MSVLAIIPARGGSKGIRGKNLRCVAGRPLVAHTIAQARAASAVDRVVVSPDDDEIAAVAERWGADVGRRPDSLSGDAASSESALLHALDHLRDAEGYEPDVVVFLQCTSPLTRAEDIDNTVDALRGEDADSALAVAPFHRFVWRRDEREGAMGVNHDKRVRLLRQDREEEFVETGAVYAMRASGLREAGHRFFGKVAMYVMPAERAMEIDDPADLDVAESLMRQLGLGAEGDPALAGVRMLALDFDGVLTDNRVLVGESGREGVWCHRGDGMGIARLRAAGVEVIVLSSEENPVVGARCRKMDIECVQGLGDKRAALERAASERSIAPEQVAFVGNDVNDLECMAWAGAAIAVADAEPAALAAARLVTRRVGGRGAVREVTDWILAARGAERGSGQ